MHGQDEERLYKRDLHRINVGELKDALSFLIPQLEESTYPYPGTRMHEQSKFHYYFKPYVIAFCGKLYYGISIDKYQGEKKLGDTVNLYSFDEYQAYCDSHKVFLKRDPQFLPYMQAYKRKNSEWYSSSNLKDVQQWLENQASPKYLNQLIEEGIAIAVCYDGVSEKDDYSWPQYKSAARYQVDINCQLKGFNFYKVIDAYSAFQELDMYLSGILTVNESKMISVNDKSLLQKKGFDEFSFKKRPSQD